MIKVGLVSLGCAKNLIDSEIMIGHLQQAGMAMTPNPELADVLIINTCSFIDMAKKESIASVHEAVDGRSESKKRAKQKIIVAGCMAQRFAQELPNLMPDVDAFMYGHTYNHNTEIDVYEEPGHRYPHSLGGIRARGCNRDGTAIRAVADRIRKFTKNTCILLVISDGAPSGYGYGEDGRAHTRKAVQDVTKMGFNVIQIAIDSVDSSSMFKHWVTMNHIDSLPGDLAAFLKKKLSIMLREITIT